jgi:hypothetical protein
MVVFWYGAVRMVVFWYGAVRMVVFPVYFGS